MLLMFNEPPYAERHVRWCERTGNQLMITFLLDSLLPISRPVAYSVFFSPYRFIGISLFCVFPLPVFYFFFLIAIKSIKYL
jgi:hypothetical protein